MREWLHATLTNAFPIYNESNFLLRVILPYPDDVIPTQFLHFKVSISNKTEFGLFYPAKYHGPKKSSQPCMLMMKPYVGYQQEGCRVLHLAQVSDEK